MVWKVFEIILVRTFKISNKNLSVKLQITLVGSTALNKKQKLHFTRQSQYYIANYRNLKIYHKQ